MEILIMKDSDMSCRSYQLGLLVYNLRLLKLHSIAIYALFLGISLLITSCASVPLDHPKTVSQALENTSETKPALVFSEWLNGRKDVNGFYPLSHGFDGREYPCLIPG